MDKSPSKKRNVLVIVAILCSVPLLLMLYVLRFPIVTAYANVFHKTNVGSQFEQTVQPVIPKLHELGFTFNGSPPPGHKTHAHRCEVINNGSAFCFKSQTSDVLPVTQPFVNNWKQDSRDFETYLIKHGWRKKFNQQPIETLYDDNDPRNVWAADLHYAKTEGSIKCSITITYSASLANTNAGGTCWRNISFPDIPEPDYH